MYIFRIILPLAILFVFSNTGLAQETSVQNAQLVGGFCQGCEAVLDYGDEELSSVDTLPGFNENEPKIKITGTVYQSDGKTPAKDVIIFIHQTDREGEYPTRGDETGWERQYGYIHGYIRTGVQGKYTFYTFKPGSYGSNPAHIHPVILEPNGKYYWLESFFFAGDPNITDNHYDADSPRGGNSGVLSLKSENGMLVGQRDIILGKNIPNYE